MKDVPREKTPEGNVKEGNGCWTDAIIEGQTSSHIYNIQSRLSIWGVMRASYYVRLSFPPASNTSGCCCYLETIPDDCALHPPIPSTHSPLPPTFRAPQVVKKSSLHDVRCQHNPLDISRGSQCACLEG